MTEIYGVLYLITNTANGKQYVGQTTAPLRDYWLHRLADARNGRHRNMPIYNAIRKHGEDAFQCDCIFMAFDKAALDAAEDRLITETGSMVPRGYNCRGGGSRGKHTDAVKAILREHGRRIFNDPAVRRKIAQAQASAGTKSRRAKTKALPEIAAATSAAIRASKTDDVRRRTAESMIAHWRDPDNRKGRAQSNRRAWDNTERRKAASAALRDAYARDPTRRARMTDGVRCSHAKPQIKEKLRAGGMLGHHRRWHISRGIKNLECQWCQL